MATVWHGVALEPTLAICSLACLEGAGEPWRVVVRPGDNVHAFAVRGDELFVVQDDGSSPAFVSSIQLPDGARRGLYQPPTRRLRG